MPSAGPPRVRSAAGLQSPRPPADPSDVERPREQGPDAAAAADERRGAERLPRRRAVELRFLAPVLRGMTQNVSESGVLLASAEPLRVRLVLDTESGPEERTGRLVRVQRLDGTVTGIAVEFDAA